MVEVAKNFPPGKFSCLPLVFLLGKFLGVSFFGCPRVLPPRSPHTVSRVVRVCARKEAQERRKSKTLDAAS